MKISLIKMDNAAEVLMEGRLDSATAQEAEKVLQEIAQRYDKLILNFEKLEYVSSAGLRILKNLHFGMKRNNGQLVFKNVNRMIMEVFEMTGFVGLLKFE